MTKIVVIGHSGFIGQNMLNCCSDRGYSCHVLDRSKTCLTSRSDTAAALYNVAPDAVIFLGCPSPTNVAMEKRFLSEYLISIENVIYAMPPTCKFVYAGSMAEFGRSGIHKEDSIRSPNSTYGFLKMIAVDRVIAALQMCNKTGVIARLFGVYGPGEARTRLIPSLISSLNCNREVLLSDGLQQRDFVYVADVVNVLLDLALQKAERNIEVCNVGTGTGIIVRDLCIRLAEAMDKPKYLLKFGTKPRLPYDEEVLIADASHLKRVLKWSPTNRFSDESFLQNLVDVYNLR